MTTTTAPAEINTKLVTTTRGRKVHMSFGKRTVCHTFGTPHQIDAVLGELPGEGIDGTIASLLAANIAPSRLCGHCFYITTRARYTAQHKAAKA